MSLFFVIPVVGMITAQDNLFFAEKIRDGLNHDKRMIEENKLSEHNPIHVILKKIDSSFTECGNDISALIKKHSLGYRLNEYMDIEKNQLVQLSKQQIKQSREYINEHDRLALLFIPRDQYSPERIKPIQEYMVKTRKQLSILLLQKKQINFKFVDYDRLDFMLRNQYYPVNDAAVNDYLAWVIYMYIFAHKVD